MISVHSGILVSTKWLLTSFYFIILYHYFHYLIHPSALSILRQQREAHTPNRKEQTPSQASATSC